jgi:hypothetical protein
MSDVKNRITKTTYHVVMYHQDFEDTREYDNKFAATSDYLDCRHDWASDGYPEGKEPYIYKAEHEIYPVNITDDVEEFFDYKG